MPGDMDIKATFDISDFGHTDPVIDSYLNENMNEIIEVWWDNVGLMSLTNYINRIIKTREKGGKKDA